jgi:hypothetical protein
MMTIILQETIFQSFFPWILVEYWKTSLNSIIHHVSHHSNSECVHWSTSTSISNKAIYSIILETSNIIRIVWVLLRWEYFHSIPSHVIKLPHIKRWVLRVESWESL